MRKSWIVAIAIAVPSVTVSCSSSTDPVESNSEPVSFDKDVVPILANRCALVACHGAKESNLGIHLSLDKKQMYEELKKKSPTYTKVSLTFVVPGDAEKSFLMRKMDGDHEKICGGTCGTEMPPPEEGTTTSGVLSKETRDVMRDWIEQGAKNN